VTIGAVTRDRRPLRIAEMALAVDPTDYVGPCPATFRFRGAIRVEGHGEVSYRFGRSDRARGPVLKAEVDSSSVTRVSTSWVLGPHSGEPFEGWQTLEILTPRPLTSARAAFRMTCVR
jgi:hypothetical protein